jgi:methylthioribose-1-phosphate isomerase
VDPRASRRRTLWLAEDGWSIEVIDQRRLPHAFEVVALRSLEEVEGAIQNMSVRGAPLIGVTAAYGVCLALRADASDEASAGVGSRRGCLSPSGRARRAGSRCLVRHWRGWAADTG